MNYTDYRNETDLPFVSVIIPVLNNPEGLEKCLIALSKQTYPQYMYEIIVVDNGSEKEVYNVASKFKQIIFSHEEKPGSYAARNKGISLAKGEVLAFTDSDCIPSESWIIQGTEKLLSSPNSGLVGGKVEMFSPTSKHLNFIEFYDIIYLDQKATLQRDNYASTANLFTFSRRFNEVGLFNDELKSAGDKEWGQRVYSKGFKVLFAEDAVVNHPVRTSIWQLYKKKIRILGGLYDLENFNNRNLKGAEFIKKIGQNLKPPASFLRWRLSDDRLQGVHQKTAFVCLVIFLNYAAAFELIRLKFGGISKR